MGLPFHVSCNVQLFFRESPKVSFSRHCGIHDALPIYHLPTNLYVIKRIKENYDITEDWEGKRYLGLTFDWNYDTHSVHLSMPNYIPDALKRFKREKPKIWQGSHHQHTVPNYGAKQQFRKRRIKRTVVRQGN